MVTRRQFCALGGASALMAALPGCGAANLPLKNIRFTQEDYRRVPALGLATSLHEEYDYAAEIEGTLPPALQGTLYRNGPGLFERAGYRKRCLLDGDGMVQAFQFDGQGARFRNRFVRTEKFKEESAAGRFLYATWSTQAPGGMLSNLGGGDFSSQAGVTVLIHDGRLYAFDEFHPPHRLDPDTLATEGVSWLGLPPESTVFSAHSKRDRRNGDWIFFGLEFGPRPRLHLTALRSDGTLRKHQVHPLEKNVYMHDFFVSDRHILIHLHPVEISVLPLLVGLKSITGSMRWRPEKGSKVLIFDREENSPPRILETEASWMWHSLNAYERGGEIVADFVGYENPDHFLGENPALFALMEGRRGHYRYPGELRRFVIPASGNRMVQETVSTANHEFPQINLHHQCRRHRFGYYLRISEGNSFFDEVVRIDHRDGRSDAFRFEPGHFCTEPIFAPVPNYAYEADGEEPGWLLSEVYDSRRNRSYLAVLQADNPAAGPVARIWLRHHVPLGFHGFWAPA